MPLNAKLMLKKRLGLLQEPFILLYRGFGNRHEVHIKGRVLEVKAVATPEAKHSSWRNFREMAQRYFSDFYPDMKVRVSCAGQQQVVQTHDDGLFEVIFRYEEPLELGWLPTEACLEDRPEEIFAEGEVLIADGEEGLGVVSDIDDTVLISRINETAKALRLLLFRNARSRMPFEGVAAFYKALCHNAVGPPNPIFYVSSSEWNLYDLLEDFFDYNHIAKGPFLLHDYRTSLLTLRMRDQERHNHKLDKLRVILQTYPGRQFVLIGDSGQHDAELYARIAVEQPGRIKAVFIRNVSDSQRAKEVQRIYHSIGENLPPMMLVNNSLEAAREAVKLGLLNEEDLAAIEEDMRRDRG